MTFEQKIDRYLALVAWARKRYTDQHHRLVVSIGGCLQAYNRIENAAAAKYLGCTHLKAR